VEQQKLLISFTIFAKVKGDIKKEDNLRKMTELIKDIQKRVFKRH
jgi:hypothetical protein